ncbi:hypothetical protein [uncultured Shewanella sp.]|uniref:hypothetical protein n=1 Tax=uncultured Shewanella sp. TaxID=173975 RepID=UPI00262DF5A3|nr:hypothetical protein [uncultured Shewanella sp.]
MLALMIVIALILVGFYVYFAEWMQRRVFAAIGLITLYFVMYWLFAPDDRATQRLMPLLGMIPMFSFAAILFPQLNQHHLEEVTEGLGWFGLISVSLILLFFTIYVW